MKKLEFRMWNPMTKKIESSNLNFIRFDGRYFFGNADFSDSPFCGEVLQYTGLKERKSIESTKPIEKIFEGHIVRCYGGEYCQGRWEQDDVIVIKNLINDCFMMGESEYVEIMGNIFNNPELIPEEREFIPDENELIY